MAGIASKRCPVCHEVSLISDRGAIQAVGKTTLVGVTGNTASAVCGCGQTVSWERKVERHSTQPLHPLVAAHPKRLEVCIVEGHAPLNAAGGSDTGEKLVLAQNICTRCGTVYATAIYL